MKVGNGEIIPASEGYASKAACSNGIESVQKNCLDEGCFEKTTTESGKFRFNLKARNGQVIGTSQNYESEAARDNGIAAVGRAAPEAPVVEAA